MTNLHLINLLKYSIISLIIYNLITLFILFTPVNSLKLKLWKLTPYDYTFIINFPNNFKKKSLLNSINRDQINLFLNKNINRNLLNVNFWNQRLIISNFEGKSKEIEKQFINLFFLTKNNKNFNLDLKKYFILNYDNFSEENKKIILDEY